LHPSVVHSAFDALEFLFLRLLAARFEDLFETADVELGFLEMRFECVPQFFGRGGIAQIGQRIDESLFGVVRATKGFDK